MNNYKRYTLQDTLDSEKRALFNVLSTFAGGGGSSTGYRLAGAKILAVNEFVEVTSPVYLIISSSTRRYPGFKLFTGIFSKLVNIPTELTTMGSVEDGDTEAFSVTGLSSGCIPVRTT